METNAPPSWSVPFRLGPYEALERLGSGGFASVFRARDLRITNEERLVALKVVPPGTDDESVRRLMREARAVSRLSHPNVVRVFECGVTNDGAYVAMELLEGRSLQDILDEGPISVERSLDIALQVLDGLAAAHASRIIHRDVKPGNIFVTKGPTGLDVPHILDFGVSKMGMVTGSTSQQERTLPGTALGTPGFMAPEQYGSAHVADARADVYGVGATLFAMLTGRLPFDAATYESWHMKVKGERAPVITALAPHVSIELARTIDRALSRDPDARWPTASDFANALLGSAPVLSNRTFRMKHESVVDHTSPAMPRPNVTGAVASNAPSTPRTENNEPPTEPTPPPDLAKKVDTTPVNTRRRTKRRKQRGGGLWFVSGALVGALLAALGAGIAFWARSRQLPPTPPPAPNERVAPSVTAPTTEPSATSMSVAPNGTPPITEPRTPFPAPVPPPKRPDELTPTERK